MTNNFIFPFQ